MGCRGGPWGGGGSLLGGCGGPWGQGVRGEGRRRALWVGARLGGCGTGVPMGVSPPPRLSWGLPGVLLWSLRRPGPPRRAFLLPPPPAVALFSRFSGRFWRPVASGRAASGASRSFGARPAHACARASNTPLHMRVPLPAHASNAPVSQPAPASPQACAPSCTHNCTCMCSACTHIVTCMCLLVCVHNCTLHMCAYPQSHTVCTRACTHVCTAASRAQS